jgi:hypothetical protein
MYNTVILTSGLTGSSVLAGFLARGGYWSGDRTYKKTDYDTFENQDLIRLNTELLQSASFEQAYLTTYSPQVIEQVASLTGALDVEPFREFYRRCDSHSPWVWKDPRLSVTIRFWSRVVDLSKCNFLLLTRNHFQSWVSTNSRYIVQSMRHTREYETAIYESNLAFLEENRLPYQQLSYEGLIARPEQTISRLNRFLGSQLTLDHLAATYNGALHRRPGSSLPRIARATLVYLKNYRERVDGVHPYAHSRP